MLKAFEPQGRLHPAVSGLFCLRCEATYPVGDYDEGCIRCRREGFPANLAVKYRSPGERVMLPYSGEFTLGEGNTPLVEAPELAKEIGVGRLSLKLEWCNPTGSHKDRMSAQLIARARDRGAVEIVASSSGNAGISLAAYAARAGIAAEIVATPSLPRSFRAAITRYRGQITYETDSLARWTYAARRAGQGAFAGTNYVLPAVGTNPFGIEGYKTLASEIRAVADPDLVVVPTARGDLLSGLQLGFAELGASPRLIAVEPFPRLSRALAGEDYRVLFEGRTAQFSTAGPTVTYQALRAVRLSGGTAIPVDDEAAGAAARRLGRSGFHAELAAAATLAGLTTLARNGPVSGQHAVIVLTGSGFRDPAAESLRESAAA